MEIEVIDQNDNAPRFQQETINIEIFENSHAAYSLDHQMAYDPDIGKLSIDCFFVEVNCEKMGLF